LHSFTQTLSVTELVSLTLPTNSILYTFILTSFFDYFYLNHVSRINIFICFNQNQNIIFLLDLVLSTSCSSTICHQRAFSLPQNSNLNVINNQNVPSSTVGNTSNNNGKSFAIQPVHQRTRSLPLTEETAIDFSQSPPNFMSFGTNVAENSKISNNSMESIIEDYQNVDMSGSSGSRLSNGNSSILKHLSKISNTSSSSSPSLRKKRHHHNVMRSTYQISPQTKNVVNDCKTKSDRDDTILNQSI
jgi:hypothetical protein